MKIFFVQIIIFISFLFSSISSTTKKIPKYLGSNIVEDIKKLLFILPEDITVSFNNSLINVTLYNTSDKSFSYDKMNINFENCLTILQKVYDLDPFFDYNNQNSNEIYKRCFFIIIKIEIDRKIAKDNTSLINNYINNVSIQVTFDEKSDTISLAKNNNITKRPTNHIEYLIFNGKNGKLLNTTYCNDLNVKILHPIVKQDIIDLNSSKQFYEEYKVDVFRSNDSFFNDICLNFTSEKKKDMPLSLKRKYFYQNVSFCDENCTYIEVNYTSNTAVCACEVNGIMNDEKLFVENNIDDKTFTYNDMISVINYKIFKCYKQVFDFRRLSKNVGNYFSFFLILVYTFCIIDFYRNRKKNVMEYFQKIKVRLQDENFRIINQNKDKKSSNSNNKILEQKNKSDKSEKNNESNYQENNKSINNNNLDEDQKEENNNKSINEININDISFKDIASNPPVKKLKLKLKTNKKDNGNEENQNKNIKKNIKYILNINNSATKDTYNYGEIKLDTADELIDTKHNNKNENLERNWNEIITIKKKANNRPINITNSMLSSTKNNTIKSKTKKSSDSSNLNKTNSNNNNDEKTNNNKYKNFNNIFPSNFSVEIPISNIVPSFLKSKNHLLNMNNINIQNMNINSRNSRNFNVLNASKDLRSSQNSLNTFIFKRTKTKNNNALHNNFISKHDQDLSSNKEDKNSDWNKNSNKLNNQRFNNFKRSTLRRTKEIEATKKNKDKKKEGKKGGKSFFADYDDMKFEIAILIDNRNFCEKFICELKEKCIIILLLCRKDVIFKQIELSLFVLSCTLDYFFNAFLYSDIYLQEEFEQDNLVRIFIDYPKEILASMASQFLVKLIELLMEERAFSLFIKRVAISNRNYLKAINFLLKKYEKRFRLYIIIGYIFLVLTWYFTSAFCTVYQNSQFNLLYDTLESLGLNIFLPFPLSFISVVCRHFAVLKLNKCLFFLSNIFRIFA